MREADDLTQSFHQFPAKPPGKPSTGSSTGSQHTGSHHGGGGSGSGGSGGGGGGIGPGGGGDDLIEQLRTMIHPIDPFLNRRTGPGGASMRGALGSFQYMAPEMARRARDGDEPDNELDNVESFLNNCAELFIWVQPRTTACRQAWLQFRSFLHPTTEGTSGAPNFVLYKSTADRYQECVPVIQQINAFLGTHHPSPQYPQIVQAWQGFHQLWSPLAPELNDWLQQFMQHHPDPHNLRRGQPEPGA